MDKLEYVELTYHGFNEQGDKIICHYASGKQTTHDYTQKSANKYLLHCAKHHCHSWVITPQYSLFSFTSAIVLVFKQG